MMSAAVRDLHLLYPGRYQTDVRTVCPELWLHNPWITPLREGEPGVEMIPCSYPLINECNRAPYHCLHGFIDFLNSRLGLAIRPTCFRGDIHLSAEERSWFSQVRELAGRDIPFWIISAGGKYDATVKWWDPVRYQRVVDALRGRVQFVQIGQRGHHHPRLEGVIDLRGRTNLRELVRLVYHSHGVVGPVTALMHLAAAVPQPPDRTAGRGAVIIAGGREPAHWEAYPGHQFLHANGMLPCAQNGGCWKDRVRPLRDGDSRDRREHRCLDVVGDLPRCLDMIQAEDVVRRIEGYFRGGAMKFLTPAETRAAAKAVSATASNPYDRQPLNIHSAGLALDRHVRTVAGAALKGSGKGVVITVGEPSSASRVLRILAEMRRKGCRVPVEVWHLPAVRFSRSQSRRLANLDARCFNAQALRKRAPLRLLGRESLRAYALVHSGFEQVFLLDAAGGHGREVSESLFELDKLQAAGAVFWRGGERRHNGSASAIWRSCGLRRPGHGGVDATRMLVDRRRCGRALRLALWFHKNLDFYSRHVESCGELFLLAFRKARRSYALLAAASCRQAVVTPAESASTRSDKAKSEGASRV
jgi:putative component of toxin-antitoxin plasmid stabilization module